VTTTSGRFRNRAAAASDTFTGKPRRSVLPWPSSNVSVDPV
jgi:hypothetical protein